MQKKKPNKNNIKQKTATTTKKKEKKSKQTNKNTNTTIYANLQEKICQCETINGKDHRTNSFKKIIQIVILQFLI